MRVRFKDMVIICALATMWLLAVVVIARIVSDGSMVEQCNKHGVAIRGGTAYICKPVDIKSEVLKNG